ncbi:hypothetical protein NKDENANG_01487 [Candidatus Entotheonellaceae bacterium PAL068K]
MTDTALLEALHDPAVYPEPTTKVEVHETHISVVLVTDHWAYKIKKPVNLGFLDYSTLERRRFYCLQELSLNRRLSSDIYLEVVAIHRDQQHYAFNGNGPVVEYAVKMRRLPADRTLQAHLQRGTVAPQVLEELAHRLVIFHKTHLLPTLPEHSGSLAQVLADWQENFVQTTDCMGHSLCQQTYTQIRQAVTGFAERHPDWFAQRQREGRIRDCHGDLRAEHIYLLEHGQMRIIDCIEFNKRFRYIDVASEVAFLAMDLERLGFAALANHFIQAYVQGSEDVALYRLLDFYRCYRAYVRGKVASIRLHEASSLPERPGLKRQAKGYFSLAARYAARLLRPLLIMTTGLIGSGKSSVAAGVAQALDLQVFSSDRVRKEQAGMRPKTPQRVAYGTGIYCPSASRRTYERLADLARETLVQGQSVVLDASFAQQAERQRLARLACEVRADLVMLECLAPEEVLRGRLQMRLQSPESISDGRCELLPQFQDDYEPLQENEPGYHIRLHTTQSLELCVQQALAAIQKGRP